METTNTQQYEKDAYELGVEHAKNAAGWIIDGNTKVEFIPAVLEMMDNGDPQYEEYLPAQPNLSGEWAADELTPTSLYREITGKDANPDVDGLAFETMHGWLLDKLANEYERGVSETFEPECERILRAAIS